MAYFLSGSVIINDSRELIGINTAGISTALYVGENIQLDAASGIITATQYFGDGSNLSGVGLNSQTDYEVNNLVAIGSVTAANFYGDGSDLINIPGLSWIATGTQTTRPDGTAIQDGDLYYDPTALRQFTYYDGDAGGWRDSNPATNSAVSVTVGLDTALVIPGEDTLTFEASPATGEIVIGINTVTDTLTFGIDDDLRVGTSLQVGAGISIFGNTIDSADGTPIQYFGDGSNLTGIGLAPDSDIITAGNIQAGVITATTSLEATVASGIGLTVTSDSYFGGDVTVAGDLEANDVNTTSDVSKKENIQEIGEALSKVGQLKGVTFDWIDSGQSSGGIIAQDVEKVLPTLVRDGDDHKTVIYNGVVGLLVQAVKELTAEVEELKQNK